MKGFRKLIRLNLFVVHQVKSLDQIRVIQTQMPDTWKTCLNCIKFYDPDSCLAKCFTTSLLSLDPKVFFNVFETKECYLVENHNDLRTKQSWPIKKKVDETCPLSGGGTCSHDPLNLFFYFIPRSSFIKPPVP